MTSRYVVFASAGTAAAIGATAALALAPLGGASLLPELPRILQLHGVDISVFAVVAHLIALILCLPALGEARTRVRRLIVTVSSLLTTLGTLALYYALFLTAWSNISSVCGVEWCDPHRYDSVWFALLIAVVLFAAAAALLGRLNRPAPARDTALRIGLLLLAALPFVTVIGLVGTLRLARRDASVQPARAREVVDA